MIKSGAQIAQSDCIKTTQEYLIVFKANNRFALNIVCLGVLMQDDGNICNPIFGRKMRAKPQARFNQRFLVKNDPKGAAK